MREDLAEAGRALSEGLRFAREAWRTAWAPLLICTVGATALLVADRIDLPPDAVAALGWSGLALLVLGWAPKLGALHRAAQGGEPAAGLGAGGLQLGRTEWRLLATAVALTGFAALTAGLLTVTVLVVLTALRPLGAVEVWPGMRLGVGFLLSSPLLALLLLAVLSVVGRLAVTLPADAVERSPRFARGWILTRGRALAPALVLLATTVLPLVALFGLQAMLDGLARAETGPWSAGRRPALDAVAAGVVLAGLSQFVFAPLSAGALASLHRMGLVREAEAEASLRPQAANDDQPIVAEPPPRDYRAADAATSPHAAPSDPPAA